MSRQAYVNNRFQRDQMGGKFVEVYDFAVHGGAVGTITLPTKVPAGAVIKEAYAVVETAGTSGGSATISVGLNTTSDLLGTTAGAVANLTANAVIPLLTNYTAALDGNAAAAGVNGNTPIRLTAERQLKVAIGTAALTAGKINFYIEYFGPFDIKPVTTLPDYAV